MVGWHHRDRDLGASPVETVKDREAWCAQSMGLQRAGHT